MANTTISFTADQSLFDLFTTAACVQYGYQATINGSPNPQSPAEFAQQCIIAFATQVAKSYQAQQAAEAARQAAIQAIDDTVAANPISVTVQ